jgi:hypothetical protein
MNVKPLLPAVLLAFAAAFPASAQFRSDLQDLFGPFQLQQGERENQIQVDYNVDFHYFFDYRDFSASSGIFMESETINVARFSPSAVVRFNQGREATHRLTLGIDLTKDLGANPTKYVEYSQKENDPSLRNTGLMKDIFFYYNYIRHTKTGFLGFYAGIHPRTVLQGDYSRAFFADDIIYYDPNIEGVTAQFYSPHFSAEVVTDLMSKKGVDRTGGAMAFTSLEYRPFKWAALGLSAAFTHASGNILYDCDVDYALGSPYIKFDFAPLLGMQEFYLKGAALATYQIDHDIILQDTETGELYDEKPHFPNGIEGTLGLRHWNIGIEDTFYYGLNLMTYRGSAYEEIADTDKYVDTIYQGETFYFTRRSVPTWYNRAEVYWQPLLTDFVRARVSGIGHLITPAGQDPGTRIGPFLGFQAKASLIFDLDAFRHPRESAPAGRGTRNRRTERRSGGPLLSL